MGFGLIRRRKPIGLLSFECFNATGIIRSLERQVVYQLLVNGIKVCAYVADFTYYDIERDCFVVEDVKSEATRKQRAYRIKRKLFEAINAPLTITEI